MGGAGTDGALGVAVDRNTGAAVVVGNTSAPFSGADFPTASAAQGTRGGGTDAFVTRFNTTGTALTFSTFRGGSGTDLGAAVAVDASGSAVVAGTEGSGGFLYRYTADGVVAASAAPSAALSGVALDSRERVYVTGGGFTARYSGVGAPADYTINAGGNAIAVDEQFRAVVVSGGTVRGDNALEGLEGVVGTFMWDGAVAGTEKWYATGGALAQTQTWTYDAAGRTLTAQDPDGTYTFAYDAAGRATSVLEPFALVLTFGYDTAGNRTSVKDSKGGVTTVTFDALNRQTSEATAGTGVTATRFDHAYTARGQVASLTRYSNVAGTTVVGTTTLDYDAAGRETHLLHRNGAGTALANYTYTYDAADRLSTKVEGGTVTSYAYDAADQLTADGATTFGYDATGNRTNSGYATGTGNRTTTDGVWTYTYDAEGNVTKRSKGASSDTWAYGYDHRNQMTSAAFSATDGGTVTQRVTYTYDAFGVRIQRQAWDGVATTTERFGVDGWDPAKAAPVGTEQFDAWVDLDGTNALTVRRSFGPGFDELVAGQDAGGTVRGYLTDRQGSVRHLVDGTGAVTATLAYSAYGEVTASTGTPDRYRYTGRELDSATGLQFNRARIYDAASGKWLSADPMGFAAGDANLYRYVGNSATNTTDPSGYAPVIAGYLDWRQLAIRSGAKVTGATIPRQANHAAISLSQEVKNSYSVISYTRGERVRLKDVVVEMPTWRFGDLLDCQMTLPAAGVRLRVRSTPHGNGTDPGLRWSWEGGIAAKEANSHGLLAYSLPFIAPRTKFTFPDVLSDVAASLPRTINQYDFKLQFELSYDNGRQWIPLDSSPNSYTLFATYSQPGGTGAYAALGGLAGTLPVADSNNDVRRIYLQASVKAAKGTDPQTDDEAVRAIFRAFEDRKFSIVAPETNKSQSPTYWATWQSGAKSADQLLAKGDGMCGQWARLFLKMLRAQGLVPTGANGMYDAVSSTPIKKGEVAESMLIKGQWEPLATARKLDPAVERRGNSYAWFSLRDKSHQNTSLFSLFQNAKAIPAFPEDPRNWLNTFAMRPENSGLIAQNTRNPLPAFDDHAFAIWNGRVYDPSYGTQWDDKTAFVKGAIAAFAIPALVQKTDVWLFREPTGEKDLKWSQVRE